MRPNDWEFVDPAPAPDPLIEGLLSAVAGDRSRYTQQRQKQAKRQQSPALFFRGFQNGFPLIEQPGAEPYPAGRIITNGAILQGQSLVNTGRGNTLHLNQMPRVIVPRPVVTPPTIATYGAAIVWLRDFYPPQIEGGSTRYTERWLFWIGGDREIPYRFDDITVTYLLPFTTPAAGGDRRITYAILEDDQILFHAGLVANFAPASAFEDDFRLVGANTWAIAPTTETITKSAPQPLPYGSWVDFLIDPFQGDACLDFLQNAGASKIGEQYYGTAISIPTTGEKDERLVTLTPLKTPGAGGGCSLPQPPKYATVEVWPVNPSAIAATYTPVGTTTVTTTYMAFATDLRDAP